MMDLWKRNKTFEELADEIGLANIFSGTDADETIQQAFLEWLFDYRLCSDNDNTFLRYFRRRFNNLYPRYLEQVRILTTRENFDPFVTEYFQDLVNKIGEENSTDSKIGSGSSNSTVNSLKNSTNNTTRTPNITESVIDHGANTTINSTQNSGIDTFRKTGSDSVSYLGSENENRTGYDELEKLGKETNAKSGTDTVNKTGTDSTVKTGHDDLEKFGSETNHKTGYDTATRTGRQDNYKYGSETTYHSEDGVSTTDGKSDGFAMQYPEANLGSLPAGGVGYDLNEYGNVIQGGWATASRDIAYANSESLALSGSMSKNQGTARSTVSYGVNARGGDDIRFDRTNYDNLQDKTDHNTNDELSFANRKDTTTYNTSENRNLNYSDDTTYSNQNDLTFTNRKDRTNYSSGVTHNINKSDTTNYGSTDTTTHGHNVAFNETVSNDNTSTRTQIGSESTNSTINGSDTQNVSGRTMSNETINGQRNVNDTVKQEHKGRNESVADIIPRAIKAIINTNELMWFIDSMKVCFDCTDLY